MSARAKAADRDALMGATIDVERDALAKQAGIVARLEAAEAALTAAQKARKALVARAEDGTLPTGATRILDEKVREAEGLVTILREAMPAAERRLKIATEAVHALLQDEVGRLAEAAEARGAAAAEALAAAQAEFKAAGFYVSQAQDLVGLRRMVPAEQWRAVVVKRIAEAKAALDAARLGRAA